MSDVLFHSKYMKVFLLALKQVWGQTQLKPLMDNQTVECVLNNMI